MKNNKYIHKKKKGMSLVEIVIVLAISTVVLGIMYSLLTGTTKSRVSQEVTSTLQKEAADIQNELVKIGAHCDIIEYITKINDDGTLDTRMPPSFNYTTDLGTGNSIKISSIRLNFRGETNDNYKYVIELRSHVTDTLFDLVIVQEDNTNTVIGEKVLATHVVGVDIKPLDFNSVPDITTATFENTTGLQFIIKLNMKKGYSNVVTDFKVLVKFRNKDV